MPLSWFTPHVELVRTLIASGADVHVRDARGATALHTTARSGDGEIVRVLVDAGAGGDGRHERSGATALTRGAFWNPNLDIILTLLEAGADPHTRDRIGMTRGFNCQRLTEQGPYGRHRHVEAMRVIGER